MADLEERLRRVEPNGGYDYECEGHQEIAREAADLISAQSQTISDLTEVARIAGLVESQVGSTLQFIQDTAPGTNLKSDLLLIEALRAALSSARSVSTE